MPIYRARLRIITTWDGATFEADNREDAERKGRALSLAALVENREARLDVQVMCASQADIDAFEAFRVEHGECEEERAPVDDGPHPAGTDNDVANE